MKASTYVRGATAKRAATAFSAVLATISLALTSQAQVTLAPGDNSSIVVNPSTGSAANWIVDGNNILNSLSGGVQGLFYSVGGGTPAGIQSGTSGIVSSAVTHPTADSASFGSTYTYTSGAFSLQAVYTLTGGPVGSGNSDFQETINVKNTQATALTFHFFQYANFTIDPTATVALSTQTYRGTPLYTLAEINGGSLNLSEYVDGSLNPGANKGTINSTQISAFLTPAAGFQLPGSAVNTNGAGSAWVLEWDVTIPQNQTFILSKDIDVTGIVPTPEPSEYALLSFGLLAFGAFRYYRRQPAK